MPDYESLAPGVYNARFDLIPRERYLLDHWRPPTLEAVERYCRGRRVLDLGCGFGDYTRSVRHADIVVGVDLSSRWLRYAKSVAGIKNLVRADAHHVPLRTAAFDAVVSVGLLEFVDPVRAIGEISRLLKPGGYCVLVSSNRLSAFRGVLRLVLRSLGRTYDRRETSLSELSQAMAEHGMNVIESRMDDGLIWLPDWLDRRIGARVYPLVERSLRPLGRNPFSNELLLVGRKNG